MKRSKRTSKLNGQVVRSNHVLSRELIMRDDPQEWAVLLGMLGFSAKAIARQTGYTRATVYFYLHKRGVKLRSYRDGENTFANVVIRNTAKLPMRSPVNLALTGRLALPAGE